jgi:hypothetical protein
VVHERRETDLKLGRLAAPPEVAVRDQRRGSSSYLRRAGTGVAAPPRGAATPQSADRGSAPALRGAAERGPHLPDGPPREQEHAEAHKGAYSPTSRASMLPAALRPRPARAHKLVWATAAEADASE